jgi:hypothetical protein
MPEVPKIVHERLRAVGDNRAGDHPDANALTAFAEQALGMTERENVMAHLSACDECRELLAVRSPDLEVVPTGEAERTAPASSADRVSATGRRSWIAWNRLGWVGLAAGVAIAVGVLVTHSDKQNLGEARQNSASAPSPTAAPPAATTDAKVTALPPSSEPAVAAANQPTPRAPATRRDEMRKFAAPASVLKERNTFENKLEASAARKDTLAGPVLKTPAPQAGLAKDTVEVTAAAPAPVMPNQTADTLAANEAAPVRRAKAARALDAPAAMQTVTANAKQAEVQPEIAGSATGQIGARSDLRQMPLNGGNANEMLQLSQVAALWRVRGEHLEQSLDSGAHWKSMLQTHRALLSVAATNADVWAGGKSGDLFHSSNAGISWNQVHPAINGQTLADDITHIDVYSATKIVLLTSKNESWSTSDGGTTWDKK